MAETDRCAGEQITHNGGSALARCRSGSTDQPQCATEQLRIVYDEPMAFFGFGYPILLATGAATGLPSPAHETS
jgi:hypothetical protein